MTVRALAAATGIAFAALLVVLVVVQTRSSDLVAGGDLGPAPAPILAPAVLVAATPTTVPLPSPTPTAFPTATPTATALPSPTPVPRQLTVSFSGDILSHMPVIERARANSTGDLAFDYRPMFAQVQSRLDGVDLALCVLETPLSADNGDLSGYPSFNAPGDLADALVAAGFDGCATASNHSLDRGEVGVNETLGELDRVQLGHAGMARTAAEAAEPTIYNANGLQLAHVSFTYGLNGYVRPDGKDWMVDVTDPALVLGAAARARSAGADIVVLTIQWGDEYVTDPTADQQTLAEIFAASADIDLIVGNHAHVVQPIDTVGDTTVVYGLGNFLSNQPAPGYPARTQDGMIVEVTFTEARPGEPVVSQVVVVPTWVDKSTYTIMPVVAALADPATPAGLRSELEVSFDRTSEAVSRLGAAVTFE